MFSLLRCGIRLCCCVPATLVSYPPGPSDDVFQPLGCCVFGSGVAPPGRAGLLRSSTGRSIPLRPGCAYALSRTKFGSALSPSRASGFSESRTARIEPATPVRPSRRTGSTWRT